MAERKLDWEIRENNHASVSQGIDVYINNGNYYLQFIGGSQLIVESLGSTETKDLDKALCIAEGLLLNILDEERLALLNIRETIRPLVKEQAPVIIDENAKIIADQIKSKEYFLALLLIAIFIIAQIIIFGKYL